MAIKVKAKDADTLEEELEEWSLGVNLVNTAPTHTKETVTFSTDQIKKLDNRNQVKIQKNNQ
ncbi:hypothetical protein [Catenibacterium sp. AM22-6LB]|uniref:hypothetical protein n=1 Tax=Catenibacterium sp. AM22-6LB TaxID=2292992 RepID=UPI001F2D8CFC|nr:hypothetical protein [Catenibacterium sp. AM22-6LB]